MVALGADTSGYRVFYGVVVRAKHFSSSGAVLARAMRVGCERRRPPLPEGQPVALTPAFYSDPKRAAEWQRYLSRNSLPGAPPDFAAVGEHLQTFLGPIWRALEASRAFADAWAPAGPWAPAAPGRELRT